MSLTDITESRFIVKCPNCSNEFNINSDEDITFDDFSQIISLVCPECGYEEDH